MDYANADDLLKIYGNRNPISNFIFDAQIADQSQKRQLSLEEGFLNNQAKDIANTFSRNVNPIKLEQEQANLFSTKTKNESDALSLDSKKRTHESDINLKLRETVSKMKEQDLKDLITEGERLVYSNDPAERQAGLELRMLGKEFQKILYQEQQTRETQARQNDNAISLEKIRQSGREKLLTERLSAKQAAGSKANEITKTILDSVKAGKMSAEKAAVAFAVQAQMEDDPEIQAKYFTIASQMEELARSVRAAADPNAGKTAIQGLPTKPAAPLAIQPSVSLGQSQVPSRQVPNTLADVQKMYPGVPAEKLKQAYKQKFGVDLK